MNLVYGTTQPQVLGSLIRGRELDSLIRKGVRIVLYCMLVTNDNRKESTHDHFEPLTSTLAIIV